MSRRRLSLLLAGVGLQLILNLSALASGTYLYVSPDGDDANPGTEAAPFKTLEKARNAIRVIKGLPVGLPAGGVTVVLRGGVYTVTNTIALTSADSGGTNSCITYRSAPGEVATLYGGQVIPRAAFVACTNTAVLNRVISVAVRASLLECDLTARGITDFGKLSWHGFSMSTPDTPLELFVNGQHLTRARYPNKGAADLHINTIVDVGPVSGDSDYTTHGGVFTCTNARPAQWAQATNAWVNGVLSKDWSWTYNRIAGYNAGSKQITLACGMPYGLIKGSDFFFVENILEEIDVAGEYYLDPDAGKLYLLPPAGFDSAEISVSVLSDPMLTVSGTEFVSFRGLRFMTSRDLGVSGTANHVRFQACEFAGLGKSGLSLTGTGNVIDSCDIHDIGGSIISLSGGDFNTLTPGSNIVDNCHIHRWGEWQRVYNPAVSLNGVGNVVRYSQFDDFPHDAIEIRGNDQLVEYNLFQDGMKDFMDLGVIYANLGKNPQSRGTVIRRNFFNGVSSTLNRQNVIYPDNATMDWLIEENIFFRTSNGGADGGGTIGSNGGSYIITRNNIFVDCSCPYDMSFFLATWAASSLPSYEASWQAVMNTYSNFVSMPHSVRYPGLPLLLVEDRVLPTSNVYEKNLVWNPTVARDFSGAYTTRGGDLSLIQARDNCIATSDPGFVDWAGGNFALRDDASVFTNIPGFQAPPFAEMGLRDEVGTPAAVEILQGGAPTNVQQTSADLSVTWLRAWGADSGVDVFWGKSDGGTNAAAWSNNVSLGTFKSVYSSNITCSVTGLAPSTSYSCRFRATNALDTVWMSVPVTFKTLGLPVVDNAGGADGDTTSSAVLRGRLVDGSAASAWICWGLMDQGRISTGRWEHVLTIGSVTQGAVFSSVATGLATNRSYWYRCYVSNEVGRAWSDAAVFSAGGSQGAGDWTPSRLQLKAWYDASDEQTLLAGTVRKWLDKSGNGLHVSRSTVADQPTTGGRTIGGLNALDFDGTDSLACGATFDCTNVSVFIVRQWDYISGVNAKSFNLIHNTTFASINEEEHGGASLEIGVDNPDHQGVQVGTALGPGLVSYVKSGSSSQRAWLDGNSRGTNSNTVSNFLVNLIYSGAPEFDGALGEMIVIKSSVSDSDREKLEGYLAHKWGLATNLPAGHPYKAAAQAGFTPSNLTTKAWYDAADASTLLPGKIWRWRDKSGNNYHASRTNPTNQPAAGVRTIGGLNVLDCDGDDTMSGSITLDCTQVSAFVVRSFDDISAVDDKSFNLINSVSPNNSINEETHGGASLEVGVDIPDNQGVAVGASLNPGLVSYVKSGSNSQRAWLDGNSKGTNVNSVSNFSVNLIYPVSSQDGAAGELIVLDSAVSDADRLKLEGYLAHKWGLAGNLPASHPYKLSGPSGGMIVNQAPTGVTPVSATLNCGLSVVNTSATVTVYWGETDGRTNVGGWANHAVLGAWTNAETNISFGVSMLTAGTQYACTFCARYGAVEEWAQASWLFSTLPTPVTLNHAVSHAWLTSFNSDWTNDFESAATNDVDGDGFPAWAEYWSGTDPMNSNSCLKIDSAAWEAGNIMIKWRNDAVWLGLPPLAIQATTNLLSGMWSNVGQALVTNGVNGWYNPASYQMFYRLAVTNAP